MNALQNTGAFKLMYRFSDFRTVLCRKYEFRLSGARYFDFRVFINIAVSMTGQRNRFFPVLYTGFNSLYNDRCPKHGAVKRGADRPVRTFPHFFQMIFRHARRIGRDRRAFDRHSVFLCRLRRIDRHLIVCLIAVFQAEIIIFRLQIDIRQ